MPNRFEFAGAKQLLRLLDAVMAIGSEQSLADALRRITEIGADLVDAEVRGVGGAGRVGVPSGGVHHGRARATRRRPASAPARRVTASSVC